MYKVPASGTQVLVYKTISNRREEEHIPSNMSDEKDTQNYYNTWFILDTYPIESLMADWGAFINTLWSTRWYIGLKPCCYRGRIIPRELP